MLKTSKISTKKDRNFVTIMGINVDSTPKDKLLNQIQEKLTKKHKFYIVTPNPEIILQAQSDPDLKQSLNSSDFAIPDGVGLKRSNRNLKPIKGRSFMLDLFKIANDKKLKIYLLGSTNVVIEKSLAKIKGEYPRIYAKGNSGPNLNSKAEPVSEVDISLHIEVVKQINSFKPDLLFIAFGAPKQEIWIQKNFQDLNCIGAMVVGGALDYYSGISKSVPALFEFLDLEWLWRLIQEPKRLRRIFKAVVVFPVKLVIDKFSNIHKTEN